MKNMLTRVSYMAFGCLLTLIGYHFGNIDNNSADAQVEFVVKEKVEIVDEIRCRKLVIVGDDDTPRITLDKDFLDRGMINIYNEDGARRIFLGVSRNYDGGAVEVIGKESGGLAASLGVDDNGGYMALWNKLIDKAILQAVVNNKGGAFLFTRDKAGYDTDTVGVEGRILFKEKTRN